MFYLQREWVQLLLTHLLLKYFYWIVIIIACIILLLLLYLLMLYIYSLSPYSTIRKDGFKICIDIYLRKNRNCYLMNHIVDVFSYYCNLSHANSIIIRFTAIICVFIYATIKS